MDNKQITMNMLIDNKHINKTAFYISLANIRFTTLNQEMMVLETDMDQDCLRNELSFI